LLHRLALDRVSLARPDGKIANVQLNGICSNFLCREDAFTKQPLVAVDPDSAKVSAEAVGLVGVLELR
jgi:hypothetical protein